MRLRHAAWLLAVLALAGCAALPPASTGTQALSGRLALQVDAQPDRPAQSISASFDLRGSAEQGELRLSTDEMREVLGDEVPLDSPEVLAWARDFLNEEE